MGPAKGKRKIGIVFCAALGLLAQLLPAPRAYAAPPEPDLSADCTLRLVMQTASGAALPGGRLAVFQVAAWEATEAGYRWAYTAPYADCGIPGETLADNANAAALERYTAEKAVPGRETVPGSDGAALFRDLPAGLYLVVQTRAAPGYLEMAPFLLALPLWSEPEGRYVYSVTAAPKCELQPEDDPGDPDPTPTPGTPTASPIPTDPAAPTPTPGTPTAPPAPTDPAAPPAWPVEGPTGAEEDPPVPGGPRLPQTGQLWWPVPVLAAGGLALLALERVLRRREDGDA